jgi:DNA-binding NarL/FixJ family response regulator
MEARQPTGAVAGGPASGGAMIRSQGHTAQQEAQQQAQVALLNVPPVYRRGLGIGLTEAGYVVQLPTDVAVWARQDAGRKIAVTTDSDAALDALDIVHRQSPDVVSVVLIEEANVAGYSRVLPRCTGAVPLHAELDDFLTAIRAAENGFTLMPIDIARELTAQGDVSLAPPQLSDRELRWLRALADNGTVLSLARSSGYSEREMYRLLSALYERLGTSSRTSALLQADRLGLLRSTVPTQQGVDRPSRGRGPGSRAADDK